MSELVIDEKTRAALSRLTAGERECLERRLRHQTAKQMALDLGVSPHAVEKRLKMARAKLGLSSSLDAARLLAAAGQYQQTGPHTPDLPDEAPARHARRHRQLIWGVPIVIVATAAALALLAQTSGSVPQSGVAPYPGPSGVAPMPSTAAGAPADGGEKARGVNGRPIVWHDYNASEMVPATPAEIHMTITNTFSVLDADRSGFIEADETMMSERGPTIEQTIYRRDAHGKVEPTGEVRRLSLAQAQAEYIAQADSDADGKWDFEEYRRWNAPILAERGIPAAWREDIERTYGHTD